MAIVADEPKSQRAPPPANQNSHTILHFQSSFESTDSSVTQPSFSEASSSVVSNIVQVVYPNTEPAPKVNPDVTGNSSSGGPTSEDSAVPPLVKKDEKASETVPSIDDKVNNSAEAPSTTTDVTPKTTEASEEATAAKKDQASQQETNRGRRRRSSGLLGGCFPFRKSSN